MTARVAMNLLWLRPGEVGGTESYASRLAAAVAALPAIDRPELGLFALSRFPSHHPDLVRQWPTIVVPHSGHPKWLRVLLESTWLPARTAAFDLIHHLGGTTPTITRQPTVLTIHDLQYLDLPQFFSAAKRAYLARSVPRSARRSTVVTTVSEFTRTTVIERLKVPHERVAVVPHAVLPAPPPDPNARVEVPRPYFLLPAMAYPHKNHAVVLDALARVPDAHLVCTGLPWSGDAAVRERAVALGISDRVHQLGRVPGVTLDALYRGAAALTFPSRYEGFGAPVIEAMQRDCPVLAADATALPEVVESAGLLLPVDDAASWADAMTRILGDDELRQRLVESGRRRAEDYRPEVAARALVAAYDLALGS